MYQKYSVDIVNVVNDLQLEMADSFMEYLDMEFLMINQPFKMINMDQLTQRAIGTQE